MKLGENKGIKTGAWVANEMLHADDINYIGQGTYANITDQFALNAVQQVVDEVVSGLLLIPKALMTCDLSAGAAVSFAGRYLTDAAWGYVADPGAVFSVIMPVIEEVAFDPADPTNPRIDVVQIQPIQTLYNLKTRQYKDPITGLITSSLTNTRYEYGYEFDVVKGTAAASPVAPAKTAGWIKVAEVTVPALATTITLGDIKSYNISSQWTTDVSITVGNANKLLKNTVVNFDASMSSATIQRLIDAQPKDLNGYSLTFQFADGTYTLISTITFSDFIGGTVYIYGNASNASLNANKLVILTFSDAAWVSVQRCGVVHFRYIKVNTTAHTTAYAALNCLHNNMLYVTQCSFLGMMSARGVQITEHGSSLVQYNYFDTYSAPIYVRLALLKTFGNSHNNCTQITCDGGVITHGDTINPTNYTQSNLGIISIPEGVFNVSFPFATPPAPTSAATASRLMLRDAAGRAQVVAPAVASDIAILSTARNQVGRLAVRQWTAITVPDGSLRGVCFSESLGLFVAVGFGAANNIQYSSNGTSWTQLTVPNGNLYGVCFSESLGLFVAVGQAGTNNIQYSSNGTSWTQLTVTDGDLTGVCFSESLGLFVAVGIAVTNNIQYSSNGISWTAITVPNGSLRTVCFSESLGLFVAVGSGATNNIQYSSNGTSWTQLTVPYGGLMGVCFSQSLGLFVAVGQAGTDNIQYSSNGTSWTQLTVPNGTLFHVCFSESLGLFVAVGSASTNNIQYSSNGISWTQLTVTNGALFDVCFPESLGLFVAVGYAAANNIQYTPALGS